jgi:hypothetical protein
MEQQNIDLAFAKPAHHVDFEADSSGQRIGDRMRDLHEQIDIAAAAAVIDARSEQQDSRLGAKALLDRRADD